MAKTPTPAQKKANAAWLKSHPKWTANRKKVAKDNLKKRQAASGTGTPTRQGIPSTLADVSAVRNSLWGPTQQKAAMDSSMAEATAAGNADLEGLPDATKIHADANQMASVIKGFGDNLFTQLGNVQTANANAANDGLSLFKDTRATADQAAAAQIIAAGGGAPQTGPPAGVASTPSLPGTTATSLAPGATSSLVNLAANANNVFGARSYAAGQQELLDQRQNQNDLKKSLYQLQENKDQVRERTAANAISLFNRQRDSIEGNIPNYLNYSLYNARDKTDAKIAGDKADANAASDAETKRYHDLMDANAKDRIKIAEQLKKGTITKAQATARYKRADAITKLANHSLAAQGSTTTGGKGKWTMIVSYQQPPGTNSVTGLPEKGGTKTRKLSFSAGQKAAWEASFKKDAQGNPIPNSGDLTKLGAQPGDIRGNNDPIPPAAATTTSTTKPWTYAQAKAFAQSIWTDPANVAKYLKSTGPFAK